MAKKQSAHYVNNKEFSAAVVEYAISVKDSEAAGTEAPTIPNYIGECFMKICEGLSHKPNFIRYSYRDEMVMDAVENCVEKVTKFDVTRETRTGLPNAFAYFTQIAFYAFLRRIAKEKKQWDIKMKYLETADCGAFAEFGADDGGSDSLIARIRNRTNSYHKEKEVDHIYDDEPKPFKKPVARGWNKKKAA